MGMKLRAIYPMHGIKGAKHCFLEAGNGNEISFVEFQDPQESQNPASFFQVWPVGMHHHMAYRYVYCVYMIVLKHSTPPSILKVIL